MGAAGWAASLADRLAGVDPLRVVLVDDETLVLDALARFLAKDSGIEVVATATTGREALRSVRETRPDVVVMDLLLKGDMDGVEATRRILNSLDPPAVLVVTSFDSDMQMRAALEAGATGFLLKTDAQESLCTAVRMAAAGDPMISPAMTSRLIASYVKPSADAATLDARRKAGLLSEREREVASLVGSGKTYGEISRELFISESTVKATIGRALRKVDADSGAQLAVIVAMARLDPA